MLTFQALLLSSFFRDDCCFNISYRPHFHQADLFLKIYSSLWLSHIFLAYNSIESYIMRRMAYMTRVHSSV
jgi:hypothetical protein